MVNEIILEVHVLWTNNRMLLMIVETNKCENVSLKGLDIVHATCNCSSALPLSLLYICTAFYYFSKNIQQMMAE